MYVLPLSGVCGHVAPGCSGTNWCLPCRHVNARVGGGGLTRAFPRPCTHSSQRCSTLGPLEQPLALCAMRARRCAGTLWLYLVRVEVVRMEVVSQGDCLRLHRSRCPRPRLGDDDVRRMTLGCSPRPRCLPSWGLVEQRSGCIPAVGRIEESWDCMRHEA